MKLLSSLLLLPMEIVDAARHFHGDFWTTYLTATQGRPAAQAWALGHDYDWPMDGADQLAEREAEEEVSEPRFATGQRSFCGQFRNSHHDAHCVGPCSDKSSAPVIHTGAGAEPTTILTPRCVLCFGPSGQCNCVDRFLGTSSPAVSADEGDSAAECDSTPPSPSAARTPGPSPTGHTAHLRGVDGEGPVDVDSAIRSAPPAGHLTWHGWALPAIFEVLAEHHYRGYTNDRCSCPLPGRPVIEDAQAWREHVGPLIADRIGCDPSRAIAALQIFKPK